MGENIFSRFYTLLILEIREKVSRNRINNNKCLEIGENRRKKQKVFGNGRKYFLLFLDTFACGKSDG